MMQRRLSPVRRGGRRFIVHSIWSQIYKLSFLDPAVAVIGIVRYAIIEQAAADIRGGSTRSSTQQSWTGGAPRYLGSQLRQR